MKFQIKLQFKLKIHVQAGLAQIKKVYVKKAGYKTVVKHVLKICALKQKENGFH